MGECLCDPGVGTEGASGVCDPGVGTEGASGGGGGGGGSGGAVADGVARLVAGDVEDGVAVVAVVAGWAVICRGFADVGMFGSPGAGGVGAPVEGVGSEGTAVVGADA